ncbi:branched-chain amino acid transport system ATP-binding protein [Palleronia marisminoris]|uniref:Sulfate/thiosulfate import ATP-binding protein CysA n=1 Tax=Palleronia marisminoris TaxID=315423 RepID=A0A1Y5TV02_9RHOB|nr:ABC transporter ATP-binding protein [Palleronia marisminoris]SFH51316.1 branched-chain amino acid transport system ATP-binding protein [Palleronia marisminoris]SLN70871.1 Sulfate/thiosulfate import ATP-binding protein CysA [Palleronia marisminoris]
MQAVADKQAEALVVEGLTRRFGALVAVDDVNLRVATGEKRAVLGANGAGKTTLFNMIAGDLPPSEGRILLAGEDITALSPQKRVLKGVRRTYQKSLVFGGLSVRDNLYVAVRGATGPRLTIWKRAEAQPDRAETDALAERVGLTDRLDVMASDLSHGEQRQLELGMALAHPPKLLLLDEPAAGLSSRERESLVEMLANLPRDLTLILIEHDLDIALKAVDYVSVMHNGRLLAEGTPAEISANQEIQDIYMGRHGK